MGFLKGSVGGVYTQRMAASTSFLGLVRGFAAAFLAAARVKHPAWDGEFAEVQLSVPCRPKHAIQFDESLAVLDVA